MTRQEILQELLLYGDTVYITDSEEELIFLLGNNLRKDFKRQHNNTHRKWFIREKKNLDGEFKNIDGKFCYVEAKK